jgi:hypothetical protein
MTDGSLVDREATLNASIKLVSAAESLADFGKLLKSALRDVATPTMDFAGADPAVTKVKQVAEQVFAASEALKEKLAGLDRLLKLDGGSDMVDFFGEVGDALLVAQRKLDTASRDYVRYAAEARDVPPAMFRIPKVQANLKFAIEKSKSRRLNVVFYGKKTEETELNQQEINFEIVAAPPDAEVVRKVAATVPGADLVLDPETRAAARIAVDRAGSFDRHTVLKEHWASTVLLRITAPAGEGLEPKLFAVLANAVENDPAKLHLNVWSIGLEPVSVALVERPMPKADAVLRQLFAALGEAQQSRLRLAGE